MALHNQWLQQGFDEGVFLLSGSIVSGCGSILAAGLSRSALEEKVKLDPFVQNEVVSYELIQIDIKKIDSRLNFLFSPDEGKQ